MEVSWKIVTAENESRDNEILTMILLNFWIEYGSIFLSKKYK